MRIVVTYALDFPESMAEEFRTEAKQRHLSLAHYYGDVMSSQLRSMVNASAKEGVGDFNANVLKVTVHDKELEDEWPTGKPDDVDMQLHNLGYTLYE